MKKVCSMLALLLVTAMCSLAQEVDDQRRVIPRQTPVTSPELRNPLPATDKNPEKLDRPEVNSSRTRRPTNEEFQRTSDKEQSDKEQKEQDEALPEPETEFQELVSKSLGHALPLFGRDLFQRTPSTFAPVDRVPVTADYVIGPGDELLFRAWGQVDIDLRLTVDRSGLVHLPKVGGLNVAGVRFDQLPGFLRTAIGRVYRNFDLTVTLGELRSIQVFVVGNARRPGAYTVSSLSTLVNTVFASGGPSPVGSMRRIQLRRGSQQVVEFDLYDLLLRGDKSRDVQLQPGDVIYVPAASDMVAISGSVQTPAIFEIRAGEDLATLLSFAGGLAPTASSRRVVIERIAEGKARRVLEVDSSGDGIHQPVLNGDLVRIGPISPKFEQAVTLRGNVENPGRYQFRAGMRIRDLLPDSQLLLTREYWEKQASLTLEEHKPVAKSTAEVEDEVERRTDDINWEYALVQRLQPDLSTELIPFNLGRALADPQSPDNLELKPEDVVTVFSQSQIAVPASRQSRYVRLEGEVATSGVYRVGPGETLRQLLRRAGGPTAQAYLFAAQFTRESVRSEQTERYKKYLDELEQQIDRAAAAPSQNREESEQKTIEVERQRRLVAQLRNVKPTGRIVLGIRPEDNSVDSFPDIPLEDGDRLFIPTQPTTVSVLGAVYNESAFLLSSNRQCDWYLQRAGGGTREADNDRTFILRADGSIVSKTMSNASWKSKFKNVLPGDTIVVPLRLERSNFMRNLKDWTQVLSQFALGAAAINVLTR